MFSVGADDGFAIGLVILIIMSTIRKNKNTLRLPNHPPPTRKKKLCPVNNYVECMLQLYLRYNII